jgi:hypothetical protein
VGAAAIETTARRRVAHRSGPMAGGEDEKKQRQSRKAGIWEHAPSRCKTQTLLGCAPLQHLPRHGRDTAVARKSTVAPGLFKSFSVFADRRVCCP